MVVSVELVLRLVSAGVSGVASVENAGLERVNYRASTVV